MLITKLTKLVLAHRKLEAETRLVGHDFITKPKIIQNFLQSSTSNKKLVMFIGQHSLLNSQKHPITMYAVIPVIKVREMVRYGRMLNEQF